MAITKYDQFDFLIDIVPRDEIKTTKPREDGTVRTSVSADQIHYYFQLAQQHQQALQQTTTPTIATTQTATGSQQIQIVQPQQLQALQVGNTIDQSNTQTNNVIISQPTTSVQQTNSVQANTVQTQGHPQQQTNTPNIQIVQQIVTPTGEVQQIPVQLTPQQLQLIRMQVQSGGNAQPIIIQAAPIQANGSNQTQLIQVSPSQSQGAQPVFLTQATNQQEEIE